MNKTKLMERVEARHGRPIEELLREQVEAGRTLEQMAVALGVSITTLHIWMFRLGGEVVERRTVRFRSEEAAV